MRVIFAALMLVPLLAALDQTIVSTALPTAYLLTSTVSGPIYGSARAAVAQARAA